MNGRNSLICCGFAAGFGLSAYLTTREADGDLFAFALSFAALGFGYLVVTMLIPPQSAWFFVRHLVAFELAVLLGVVIDAKLEEMAGALYLFEPVAVLLIVSTTALAWLFRRRA